MNREIKFKLHSKIDEKNSQVRAKKKRALSVPANQTCMKKLYLKTESVIGGYFWGKYTFSSASLLSIIEKNSSKY
jgi:hypothetical protein